MFYSTWPLWAFTAFMSIATIVEDAVRAYRKQNAAPAAVGDRVTLVRMSNVPFLVPPSNLGTVTYIARPPGGSWNIGVRWDNGRTLELVYPEDQFTVARK